MKTSKFLRSRLKKNKIIEYFGELFVKYVK
jgi:hypothetical protein